MRRLTLVRHAETAWNVERCPGAATDLPLTATGQWQAERLCSRLAGEVFTAAFSSDMFRASATASSILKAHSDLALVQVSALREADPGSAESGPGASSPLGERGTVDRLASSVQGWLDELDSVSSPGNVLVVSHGGPLRVLLCLLLGISPERHWSFRIDCASVSVVDSAPGLVTLSLLNDRCHLGSYP